MTLKAFLDRTEADIAFLSEPKVFFHSLKQLMAIFGSRYKYSLNSEDLIDPELPFIKNQAFGGTMVLWKEEHDAYISVHHVPTTAFLPVIYTFPGAPISVHIALYLPTSGLESQFIDQVTLLKATISEIMDKYQECLIFLRGDSNVNQNNKNRHRIFQSFLESLDLTRISINHKTYHHFVGDGVFDSNIDVVINPCKYPDKEEILDIFCSHQFPEIDSHHDIILSSFTFPVDDAVPEPSSLVLAPRVPNCRKKIIWSRDGVLTYQSVVSHRLTKIRDTWAKPDSKASVSLLLTITNQILDKAAAETNKFISLGTSPQVRPVKIPSEILEAKKNLKRIHTCTRQ